MEATINIRQVRTGPEAGRWMLVFGNCVRLFDSRLDATAWAANEQRTGTIFWRDAEIVVES